MNQPITDAVSAFRMPTELSSPRRSTREGEVRTLSARVVPTTTDPSKLDARTANHNAAIDVQNIQGAESLMSLHLQQQAATSVDDTEEDPENVQAPRPHNRGRSKAESLSNVLVPC
jgi:hypothetical protein